MQTRRRFRLLICAGLLSAALSGCGGSSTSESIPSTVTILYSHSVIFRNHSTFTMGYNGFGQLGDGTLTEREIAVHVPGMDNMVLPGAKAVAGNEHTMVFGNISSLVSTWGYNLYGQLGAGSKVSTTYPDAYSSRPVDVWMHATVADIAAGGYHSLAVAGDKLYAWGYNGYHQLGDNTTTNASSPVQVTTGRDGEDLTQLQAKQVAAGGLHSLALLTTGGLAPVNYVYVWGGNGYGQAGFGKTSFDTYSTSSARPRKMTFPETMSGSIEQVAALGYASLALEVQRHPDTGAITSETLWGWGYNDAGELGPGIEVLKSSPVPVPVFTVDVVATGKEIKKMVNGTNHILLLLGTPGNDGSDGSYEIQSIGNNYYGPLGNGTFVNSSSLVYVLQTLGGDRFTGATDIAAFGTSSFAKVNGVWYAWGNNNMGQLGNTVDVKSGVPYFKTPVTVKFQ